MNIDINAITQLMQLMSGEKKNAEQKPPNQNVNISSFAAQNGLGEKVDIGGSSRASGTPSPLSALMELMGGKSQSGDMMSTLMPMLLNILKKSEPPKPAPKDDSLNGASYRPTQTERSAPDRPQENYVQTPKKRAYNNSRPADDKFSPISFAGYSLISALNILINAIRKG